MTGVCEIAFFGNFLQTWFMVFVLAISSVFVFSGFVFHRYYANPTFEMWQRKSNPQYPSPKLVQKEIYHLMKGLMVGAFCPALSLWMSSNGTAKGYCGLQHGIGYEVGMFFLIWICTDFFEFFYHKTGHSTTFFWLQHKSHHQFYNPSPFSVVADDMLDQFIRSTPLIWFPLLLPTNMDLLLLEFGIFFYGYGIYLHWGYEVDFPDAHHPYINTSFQHYLHHARSGARTPYHCGFFFKIWDQLFDCVWKEECFCAKCERKKGKRSQEIWEKTVKPDYSPLLWPSFWANYVFNLGNKSANKKQS